MTPATNITDLYILKVSQVIKQQGQIFYELHCNVVLFPGKEVFPQILSDQSIPGVSWSQCWYWTNIRRELVPYYDDPWSSDAVCTQTLRATVAKVEKVRTLLFSRHMWVQRTRLLWWLLLMMLTVTNIYQGITMRWALCTAFYVLTRWILIMSFGGKYYQQHYFTDREKQQTVIALHGSNFGSWIW